MLYFMIFSASGAFAGNGIAVNGTLPSGAVECTQAQYAGGNGWALQSGAIVAVTVAPTLAQLATAALSAGLAITLSGTLTLAETVFPVDPTTTGKIGNVVLTILKTGAFPLIPGSDTPPATFPMKDASGNWHPMTTAQYGAVAAQLASYASALDLIADGNPLGATSLPTNSVSISV